MGDDVVTGPHGGARHPSPLYGGVELGGTKVMCVIGAGAEILAAERLPTRDPRSTLDAAIDFFRRGTAAGSTLHAIGIASFGPVELRRESPLWGHVTETPKPGWARVDVAGRIADALGLPVAFDTDVNGAALAEGRHGAARGLHTFVYLTVGTGIGGGAVVGGRPAHGLVHPEMGHVSVPRRPGDDYRGRCPFHGDCLEGMASGPALGERFGGPVETLGPAARDEAAALGAWYLAAGLRNVVYTLAPERIVVGGGVAQLPGLVPRIRERLRELIGPYPGLPEHADDAFVVPAELGERAGAIGALVLAESAS